VTYVTSRGGVVENLYQDVRKEVEEHAQQTGYKNAEDVRSIVQQLAKGKACGEDDIPAEFLPIPKTQTADQ